MKGFGAYAMAQWVKPPPEVSVPTHVLAALLLIQLPVSAPGEAVEDGPNLWDPEEAPGYCVKRSPPPAVAVIWGSQVADERYR